MTNIYRWTQVAIQKKKKKIIKTEFVTSRIFVLFVINIRFPPTYFGLQIYFRLSSIHDDDKKILCHKE